eukprot:gnl/Carplike_NY0171/3347_a4504_402.p1 GENE.gnl/Carplike_NY0171/3347_a4504_402~~gnl/Carplike_NY0171/3347_a4504_402.p1  ORF type:complete len:336 (-),score=68.44 gnl/Carplike_NY0171/3347_a4504_402:122-1129(-)
MDSFVLKCVKESITQFLCDCLFYRGRSDKFLVAFLREGPTYLGSGKKSSKRDSSTKTPELLQFKLNNDIIRPIGVKAYYTTGERQKKGLTQQEYMRDVHIIRPVLSHRLQQPSFLYALIHREEDIRLIWFQRFCKTISVSYSEATSHTSGRRNIELIDMLTDSSTGLAMSDESVAIDILAISVSSYLDNQFKTGISQHISMDRDVCDSLSSLVGAASVSKESFRLSLLVQILFQFYLNGREHFIKSDVGNAWVQKTIAQFPPSAIMTKFIKFHIIGCSGSEKELSTDFHVILGCLGDMFSQPNHDKIMKIINECDIDAKIKSEFKVFLKTQPEKK